MKYLEIFGTLGPSCCTKDTLMQMLKSGMNGIRLNLSHCNLWDKQEWIQEFHEACRETGIQAELMIDMRGPELRIHDIIQPINLIEGTDITLSTQVLPSQIINHSQINDILLMDDGRLSVQVIKKSEHELLCHVIHGGHLHARKSVMIQGKMISGPALTESDLKNMKAAKSFGVTAIMQPFVSSKDDLIQVKRTLKEYNADDLKIYAKIENTVGLAHLEELMPYCDVVVIARGDLGNACSLIELPRVQKQIEQLCHQYRKPYMVVTEMLNSMMEHPTPTRAEVSDVYHAVYHGASSIMLTGETASGKYPAEAMHIFKQVALRALDDRNGEII